MIAKSREALALFGGKESIDLVWNSACGFVAADFCRSFFSLNGISVQHIAKGPFPQPSGLGMSFKGNPAKYLTEIQFPLKE